MKLQASAHATSWVIRRRKSTTEPQLSMNPPANPIWLSSTEATCTPIFNHGLGGGDEETQSKKITFLQQTIDGYTLTMNICCS